MVEALYELRNEYIKFLETEAEILAAIGTFEDLSELPNIVSAIDGSHVRIKEPTDNAVDYFSRYQQHDFIIQAVANGQKLFLDFACGYPGSMHDARVLRRSAVFRKAEQGKILSAPTVHINGNELGPYLVGDSAYPLSPWLMKPYLKIPEIAMKLDSTNSFLLRELKSNVHSAYLRVDGEYCRNISIVSLNLQLKMQ